MAIQGVAEGTVETEDRRAQILRYRVATDTGPYLGTVTRVAWPQAQRRRNDSPTLPPIAARFAAPQASQVQAMGRIWDPMNPCQN